MDLLAGLNRDLDYAERLKDGLTVGLFGSFKRSHLEALRHHLREREGSTPGSHTTLRHLTQKSPARTIASMTSGWQKPYRREPGIHRPFLPGRGGRIRHQRFSHPPWRSGSSTA
ncbi:hypothetical protein [Methanoculleus chikugoensis]|uniref:hypothetical protein n=1 Tax=Methanoculleus chikugoensis TaxID=118126 RepID=UPI000A556146|nr:hypothetical protein [Methanoculleus chikugoensis]